MTTANSEVSKSSPLLAIAGNTGATVLVTGFILALILFSNTTGITQHVEISMTVPFFLLGLVLFMKTQVDGVLLMTRLLGACNSDAQVTAVITGLCLTNGVATLGMDGIYLTVSQCLWLTYIIITLASCYLLDLAYEGYLDLKVDEDHDGVPDNEEYQDKTFADKSLVQIGLISFSELILLYGDGTAANLELLTPQNFLSLTLAGLFGQWVLGVIAALIPREQFAALAQNHTFHIIGIVAFVALGGYGLFESSEGFIKEYNLQYGVAFFIMTLLSYQILKFGISKIPSAPEPEVEV
jgi:hypothetical protein